MVMVHLDESADILMVRIALIHAVAMAIEPVRAAFTELWPEAELVNILDDGLSADRAQHEDLTPAMVRRIADLGAYALTTGAAGILYTCSAFGKAIEAFAHATSQPVLKPNEAMFEQALDHGRRIGMLATFAPSVASMEEEFAELARQRGIGATIETVCVPEAMAALREGDEATHNRLLAEAAPRLDRCDTVLLAHFSTSRARVAVAQAISAPVLTAPGSAVRQLRGCLEKP
jgi:hypothetical protein